MKRESTTSAIKRLLKEHIARYRTLSPSAPVALPSLSSAEDYCAPRIHSLVSELENISETVVTSQLAFGNLLEHLLLAQTDTDKEQILTAMEEEINNYSGLVQTIIQKNEDLLISDFESVVRSLKIEATDSLTRDNVIRIRNIINAMQDTESKSKAILSQVRGILKEEKDNCEDQHDDVFET